MIYLMARIRASVIFFYLGVPARRRELRCIRTHHPMPPRRRAFHSNDFGLVPPPTIGGGGISDWQRHPFSPKSFPLQSLTHARRTPHPFRGEQRTTSSQPSPAPRFSRAPFPSPHLLRFVWCYKKEGLFEADSITLSFSIQTCSEGTPFSVTPHGRVG